MWRYCDNDFDRLFEQAVDELDMQQHIPTDEELDEMALNYEQRCNISNPMALYGAI